MDFTCNTWISHTHMKLVQKRLGCWRHSSCTAGASLQSNGTENRPFAYIYVPKIPFDVFCHYNKSSVKDIPKQGLLTLGVEHG